MPSSVDALFAEQSPLGKSSAYPSAYDPSLLFPISRSPQRAQLGIQPDRLPFMGADLWTAFELSWLNAKGKPQVAIGHFTIPCDSPNIIESKSFKLYLGSFNNARFASIEDVKTRLRADLSEAAWRDSPYQGSVGVALVDHHSFDFASVQELSGLNLDRLDVECAQFEPAPELLQAAKDESLVEETLCSQLLKSNCPVTGQPDWASVQISYTGHPIQQEGLLKYLISYRNHSGFHEHCVERIFTDIWQQCQPVQLSVYARYTRRGGLDINPFRTSSPAKLPPNIRTARQ